MILVRIPGVAGDAMLQGYRREIIKPNEPPSDWFVADSFSFGVRRNLKESGEKLGTEDVNIGVGELQECSVTKSMDRASHELARLAINGNSRDFAQIDFVEIASGKDTGTPYCYLRYVLNRCFVLSWTTNGDADSRPTETISFAYNKIAFGYRATTDGKNFESVRSMAWDNVKGDDWIDSGIEKSWPPGS